MSSVRIRPTVPIEGQKSGTSGLRKNTLTFISVANYRENFIQSILDAIDDKEGKTLVLGGDGRYLVEETAELIVQMCAANGLGKVIVGLDGLLSTPAVSALIRRRDCLGGFILTASHNPGGLNGDFGIKYNVSNGGPAPDLFTDKIYENTKKITQYKIAPDVKGNYLKEPILHKFTVDGRKFVVEVINPVDDYLQLMKEIFDFPKISAYVGTETSKRNSFCFNGMHGVTGPYIQAFAKELNLLPSNCAVNYIPSPDFNRGHPDPNLTYAADFVANAKISNWELGAAFDGDGDRNMILGKNGFFVTPSDSLAVLADHVECLPYFKNKPVKGFARSMPTSQAIDRVAKAKNLKIYEVPTGWKYFGNLMDAEEISLCGEESFGTGSDHIREKDGMWAAVAWLSLLASFEPKGVKELVEEHWLKYGRSFFLRYDYENCEAAACQKMMDTLEKKISRDFIDKRIDGILVVQADNFEYKDPIDGSIAKKQGIRIIFEDTSRIIFRLSGTGSSGATVRIYLEKFVNKDKSKEELLGDPEKSVASLVKIALELSQLEHYTGRSQPTVIT